MDSTVIRRFAVGPFHNAAPLDSLALSPPPKTTQDPGWDLEEHAIVDANDGLWLFTFEPAVRDRAASLLGASYTVVTIDCWNAFSEGATKARFRIERYEGGAVEASWADRHYPDLARAGVLPAVASEWLAQKVRSLSRAKEPSGSSKKEAEQLERARRFLALLVERSIIELAPDSSVDDLADRARRVLFRLSSTRADALANLDRMFLDSKHVEELNGDAADLDRALDDISYRRRGGGGASSEGEQATSKPPEPPVRAEWFVD